MINKFLLQFLWGVLLIVGSNTPVWLQSPDKEIALFKAAKQSVVLLKNEENLIPFQRLDTLRLAFVPMGLGQYSEWQFPLSKYTQVKTLIPEKIGSAADAKDWVQQQIGKYDYFILGIKDFPEERAFPDYYLYQFYLKALLENANCVVLLLGGNTALSMIPELTNAKALMTAPVHQSLVASVTAQILFGGIGASGRLKEDLNSTYKKGDGLETKGGLRLQYVAPSIASMDGQLLEDSISAIVKQGIVAGAFPGAQVLVAKDGKVVFHKAYGFHTYEQKVPVKTTDIYDFASVSKITSALAAVMKLHGEGKFDLDAPLKKYFPKFKRSNKSNLPYRAMLAHNAQLRPWIPYWRGTLRKNGKYPWQSDWSNSVLNDGNFRGKTFKRDSSRRYSIQVTDDLWLHRNYKKQIYKAIKLSPLNKKPGYRYSGLLFYLLPEIVETLTEMDYESYLKKNIYHRLGAYTLTYNPLRYFPKSRIIPTERDTFFRMVQIHGRVHDEGAAMMGGVSANAGLFGSANDLAKLMQMYLNGGTYGGERFINTATLQEFTRCQFCEEDNRRGLGFDKPLIEYNPDQSSVAKDASPASFGHSGYTGTFTWADPANNLLFIFFSNRVYPTRDNRKIYEMGIRPRIHNVLYKAILDKKTNSSGR